MREIDRLTTERYGVASLTLMENAAIATARVVTGYLSGDAGGKSILVFCGKGNNGGDGAATARLLATAGARVDVVLFGKLEDTKRDARVNFERLRSWNDERAVREAKETTPVNQGMINLFECESEAGWEQLVASVLESRHEVAIDARLEDTRD